VAVREAPPKKALAAGFTVSDISPTPKIPKDSAESLAKLAETERRQGFSPGLGLAESTLYEKAGDLAAAVFAAFKEVFYAYNYGYLDRQSVESRLSEVARTYPGNESVRVATEACKALLQKDSDSGLRALSALPLEIYEIDSFSRWMERVFILDRVGSSKDPKSPLVLQEYLATRSRYANLPFYWLAIARYSQGELQQDGAERAVSLAPEGPFALEGRELLAVSIGLSKKDAVAIRSRIEIESVIQDAVVSGKPEKLAQLFPLLALQDNPYTLYALGACRGLAEDPAIRDFFLKAAKKNTGRLGERLRYVAGGRL
jgi:hypothetical protein